MDEQIVQVVGRLLILMFDSKMNSNKIVEVKIQHPYAPIVGCLRSSNLVVIFCLVLESEQSEIASSWIQFVSKPLMIK